MPNEFKLGGIVPWGRVAAEYEAFFDLSDIEPACRVLDCGGGPASFAAEWGASGHFAVSVDPLYQQPLEQILSAFGSVSDRMLQGMRAARERFRWEHYGSPEGVVERRHNALHAFAADRRAAARPSGRYVAARLPTLPFAADSFDLVLCSHLLFLYSDDLDFEAHLAAIHEMLRVGREVRIFPLVDLNGQPSKHVVPTMDHFTGKVGCDIVPVPFEFQRGASSMLRLRRARQPWMSAPEPRDSAR